MLVALCGGSGQASDEEWGNRVLDCKIDGWAARVGWLWWGKMVFPKETFSAKDRNNVAAQDCQYNGAPLHFPRNLQ